MQTSFRSRYTRGIRGGMTFARTRSSLLGVFSPTAKPCLPMHDRRTSVYPATASGQHR